MGVLEQIIQMQNQGISEEEIIRNLQEQGISPRQINDAIAQMEIKNAVVGENISPEMQPSIMEQGQQNENFSSQNMYSPQTQEMSQMQNYPSENYYEGYSQTNADTIIEIADQVFSEKSQKFQTKIKELDEFKTLAETKIENSSERLKRIENILDKLQIEILGKIGNYGETLQGIKKEMSMMQDSFGKVLKKSSSHEEKSSRKK